MDSWHAFLKVLTQDPLGTEVTSSSYHNFVLLPAFQKMSSNSESWRFISLKQVEESISMVS